MENGNSRSKTEDGYPSRGEEEKGGHLRSSISSQRFVVSILAAFVLLSLLLILSWQGFVMAQTGAVVGGAGGFYAEIDQLNASGAFVYPAVGQTATCRREEGGSIIKNPTGDGRLGQGDTALPLLRADLQGASIPAGKRIRFIKAVNTPNILGLSTFSITVEQGNSPGRTTLDDTSILVRELSGDRLDLGEVFINESRTKTAADNPDDRNATFGPSPTGYLQSTGQRSMPFLGEFVVKGDTAFIQNGEAIAHFVSFSTFEINDVRIELDYNQNEEYAPDETALGGLGCPL